MTHSYSHTIATIFPSFKKISKTPLGTPPIAVTFVKETSQGFFVSEVGPRQSLPPSLCHEDMNATGGDGLDFPIGGAIFAGAKSALGPPGGRTGALICMAKKIHLSSTQARRLDRSQTLNGVCDMSDGARKISSLS